MPGTKQRLQKAPLPRPERLGQRSGATVLVNERPHLEPSHQALS